MVHVHRYISMCSLERTLEPRAIDRDTTSQSISLISYSPPTTSAIFRSSDQARHQHLIMKLAVGVVAAVCFVVTQAGKQPALQECIESCTRVLVSRFYRSYSTQRMGYSDVPTYYDDYIDCKLGCYGVSRGASQEDSSDGYLGIDPPK